jgi:DNA-binding GntR family transcriptional regulator
MAEFTVDLNRSSPVPLYHQLAEQIHRSIRTGEITPGTLLGNEIVLAERFGLSRPTMRRAIQELVERGVLVRKRGVGTQVVQGPITRSVQLSSLFDDLETADRQPRTTVLTHEVIPAPDDVAATLAVPGRHPVLHLRRLRFTRDQPLAILENYLPQHLVDIGSTDLVEVGLYQLMRASGIRMKVAKQRIGARAGRDEECSMLQEPPESPLLTMDRITHDDSGSVVEWGRHLYRASHYDYTVTLVGR